MAGGPGPISDMPVTSSGMDLVASARATAAGLLREPLPRRWSHVQAVAAVAAKVAGNDAEILVAAAWLHDVGYTPTVSRTGFHPLDGARWLREQGHPERLCGLVAYHSGAIFEAAQRGLDGELRAEFDDEQSAVRDTLWYADMTTGPDGEPMSAPDRLAGIRERYGPDHVVTRAWDQAEPYVLEAVTRVASLARRCCVTADQ